MRKYVHGLSCAAAIALFVWWSAIAYADRGYWAAGGEYAALLLLLPLLVAAVDRALQDWRDERESRAATSRYGVKDGRRGRY